jgi:hypothetical protein
MSADSRRRRFIGVARLETPSPSQPETLREIASLASADPCRRTAESSGLEKRIVGVRSHARVHLLDQRFDVAEDFVASLARRNHRADLRHRQPGHPVIDGRSSRRPRSSETRTPWRRDSAQTSRRDHRVRRRVPLGLHTTSGERSRVCGHRAKLAERRVSRTLASEHVLLCPEGDRHQPASLLAYRLSWGALTKGAESPSFVTSGSMNAMMQAALAK